MAITIRRVTKEDWQTLRDVRLTALQDAPSAFGSTYAREAAYTEDDWRQWASASTNDEVKVVLLAFDGDRCIGIGGCYDHDGTSGRIIAMWVSPDARGNHVGERLLDELIDWSRSIGRDVIDLHVTVGNASAERLYRRVGFVPTGDFQPLPSDPSYQLNRMELRLRHE